MARIGALCAFAALFASVALAEEASPTPATKATGRRQIEAQLNQPANLDFGQKSSLTVAELIQQLHDQHHLSIRYDMPALERLYGVGQGGDAPAERVLTSRACLTNDQASTIGAALGSLLTFPGGVVGRTSTMASPQVTAVATTDGPAPSSAPVAAPAAPAPLPTAPAGVKLPPPLAAESTVGPVPPAAPAVEKAGPVLPVKPAPEETAKSSARNRSSQELVKQVGELELQVSTIDPKSITIATALRLALDAFPKVDAEETAGMPIALSNATDLDWIVEDDGVLITTRMKALTYKETRVYSVKQLKDITPDELAATIRQSIRPWSWRTRIDELGARFKSSVDSAPPRALTALVNSGIKLASAETGIEVETSPVTNDSGSPRPAAGRGAGGEGPGDADKASSKSESPADVSRELREAAMVGGALVDAVTALAHTSLTAVEVFHYADPPTGSIRVLPGKLVITQSQAAHREIAELIEQLSEE